MATLPMSYQIITLSSPHAPPSPPSCRSNCRPPSLSFTLVSTKQPKKDPAKEDPYKAVGHFPFVSNNLWDLHTPMLVTFTHYDCSRVATEHLIHYSNGWKIQGRQERAASTIFLLRRPLSFTIVSSSYPPRGRSSDIKLSRAIIEQPHQKFHG